MHEFQMDQTMLLIARPIHLHCDGIIRNIAAFNIFDGSRCQLHGLTTQRKGRSPAYMDMNNAMRVALCDDVLGRKSGMV